MDSGDDHAIYWTKWPGTIAGNAWSVSLSIGSTDPLNHDYLNAWKNWLMTLNQPGERSFMLDRRSNTEYARFVAGAFKWQITGSIFANDCAGIYGTQNGVRKRAALHHYRTRILRWHRETDLRFAAGGVCGNNGFSATGISNNFRTEHCANALPGISTCGDYIIDTHDSKVVKEVWKLFPAWKLTVGGTATLLEWDPRILMPIMPNCWRHATLWTTLVTESDDAVAVSEAAVSNPVNFMVPEIVPLLQHMLKALRNATFEWSKIGTKTEIANLWHVQTSLQHMPGSLYLLPEERWSGI